MNRNLGYVIYHRNTRSIYQCKFIRCMSVERINEQLCRIKFKTWHQTHIYHSPVEIQFLVLLVKIFLLSTCVMFQLFCMSHRSYHHIINFYIQVTHKPLLLIFWLPLGINPNNWEPEAEADRSLNSRLHWSTERIPGSPGLHRETLSQRRQGGKVLTTSALIQLSALFFKSYHVMAASEVCSHWPDSPLYEIPCLTLNIQ